MKITNRRASNFHKLCVGILSFVVGLAHSYVDASQLTDQSQADADAVATAIAQLDSDDAEVKIKAIRTLSAARNNARGAIPALIKTVQDEVPAVRAQAAIALVSIDKTNLDIIAPLISLIGDAHGPVEGQPVWLIAARALIQIGEPTVPALVDVIEQADMQQTRRQAAATIVQLGPQAASAVPQLIELASDENNDHRWSAIYAMTGIGPGAASAIPVLLARLDDRDYQVQSVACRALGGIGPAAAKTIPQLIDRLENGVAGVRVSAALALGQIGNEKSVTALGNALNDKMHLVSETAMIALGEIGPPSAPIAPVIVEMVDNGKMRERIRAAATVWQMTGEVKWSVNILLSEMQKEDAPWEAVDVLADIGPAAAAAIPALTNTLTSDDFLMRFRAARALGAMAPASADSLDALRKLLDDENAEVRLQAADSIKQIEQAVAD